MANVTVTAANVQPSASTGVDSGTAGGTITAGMPVYRDSTDSNKIKPAIATSSAAAAAVGVALNGAVSGQPVSFASRGTYAAGGTLVQGGVYCVSATSGAICPYADLATGNYVTVLGVADGSNNLILDVSASGIAKP